MRECSLKNKIIIVTGWAGLLGKEFVKIVVENAGTGMIADVNEKSGNKTLDSLREISEEGEADLDKSIWKKTGIGALLNTSLNLYGCTIIYTEADA